MKYLCENRNKIKNIKNQYRYLNFFLLKKINIPIFISINLILISLNVKYK